MKEYIVIGYSTVTGEIFNWVSKSFNQAWRRGKYLANDQCLDNVRIYSGDKRYCVTVLRYRPDEWNGSNWWVKIALE